MRVTFIALDLLRFPGGGMGHGAWTQRPREPTAWRTVLVRTTFHAWGRCSVLPETAIRGYVLLPLRSRGSVQAVRPARSRATLAALRARRALGLSADGTRGKARRGIAQELGTERVKVEAVHQSVIRVIARRLTREGLTREEVLTEHVEVEPRDLARTRGLANEV